MLVSGCMGCHACSGIRWETRNLSTTAAPMFALVLSLFSVLMCLMVQPITSAAAPNGTKCPPAEGRPETCVCQPTNQDLFDLTPSPIQMEQQGTSLKFVKKLLNFNILPLDDIIIIMIRFTKVKDRNNYTYSYNPCKPYNDGDCKNVHVSHTKSIIYSWSHYNSHDRRIKIWLILTLILSILGMSNTRLWSFKAVLDSWYRDGGVTVVDRLWWDSISLLHWTCGQVSLLILKSSETHELTTKISRLLDCNFCIPRPNS